MGAEVGQALVISGKFGGWDGGAGDEAFGEDGFEVLVIAAVDGGGFASYDGRVDGWGFVEERGVDGG